MPNNKQTQEPEPMLPAEIPGGMFESILARLNSGEVVGLARTANMMQIAMHTRRDEIAIKEKLSVLAAEAGDDFFYSIPYKDHKQGCKNRRSCNCPAKPVEGPGVGLARALANMWGHCYTEVDCDAEEADRWHIRGVFIDHQTGRQKVEGRWVSKMAPAKGGRMYRVSGKQADALLAAYMSKLERDVTIRGISDAVWRPAYVLAKQAALQDKRPIKEQMARLLDRFSSAHGVSKAQIEEIIGGDWTEAGLKKCAEAQQKTVPEILAGLRGVLTALAGGEATLEEILGVGQPRASEAEIIDESGIKPEDLAGDGGEAADPPKSPEEGAGEGAGKSEDPLTTEEPGAEAEPPPPDDDEENPFDDVDVMADALTEFEAALGEAGIDVDGVYAYAKGSWKNMGLSNEDPDEWRPEDLVKIRAYLKKTWSADVKKLIAKMGDEVRSGAQ